jgi:hypothetical protein
VNRADFRKKTLRGAKVIDLIEELEGLEERARNGMDTDNKDEMYYWNGVLQFTTTFKNRMERMFRIDA